MNSVKNDDKINNLLSAIEDIKEESLIRYREERDSIITNNIKRLYRFPKKYKYINLVLDDDLIKYLRGIFKYLKDKDTLYYSHRTWFFLDTYRLTYNVRKKTSTGVSNKYINYLCCIGLLRKEFQGRIDIGYRDIIKMTDINKLFMKNNIGTPKRPMNFYSVSMYTDEYLTFIDDRAKLLYQNGITKSNLSGNMLKKHGLNEMAKEVFYSQSEDWAIMRKKRIYAEVCNTIDKLIAKQGYATKKQIEELVKMRKGELSKVCQLFSKELNKQYTYKRPNKAEKDKYQLKSDKFIYQLR